MRSRRTRSSVTDSHIDQSAWNAITGRPSGIELGWASCGESFIFLVKAYFDSSFWVLVGSYGMMGAARHALLGKGVTDGAVGFLNLGTKSGEERRPLCWKLRVLLAGW